MIDDTLLGAVKRGLERNQDLRDIIKSLTVIGYKQAEIENVIRMLHKSKEEVYMPVSIKAKHVKKEEPKREELKYVRHVNISNYIIATFLTVIIVSTLTLFLLLRSVVSSCKSLATAGIQKKFLGFLLNCTQVNSLNVVLLIAFLITSGFAVFLIIKKIKSRNP